MFQIVFQHWLQPKRRFASTELLPTGPGTGPSRPRVEVCPPAARRATSAADCEGWREQVGRWIDAVWPSLLTTTGRAHASRVVAGATPFATVRCEFMRCLGDIRIPAAATTLERIRLARSLHDLWHLRPEVFNLVACQFSQAEADRRLVPLNRHFPTRAPRSGFGALTTREGES